MAFSAWSSKRVVVRTQGPSSSLVASADWTTAANAATDDRRFLWPPSGASDLRWPPVSDSFHSMAMDVCQMGSSASRATGARPTASCDSSKFS